MQEQTLLNDHLDWLEAESIYIIREVVAQCANPAMLFSGGKDSIVMFHLARKAFQFGDRPVKLPFPILHIDTGHNYPEVIAYRDAVVQKTGVKLIVGHVEDSIKRVLFAYAKKQIHEMRLKQLPYLKRLQNMNSMR